MAKVPKWADETSYSQGEKERVPRVWKIRFGKVYLTVHRIHRVEGWFASSPFWEKKELKSETADEAKREAVKVIETELETALNQLIELEMSGPTT
jgi:hypothetical protein